MLSIIAGAESRLKITLPKPLYFLFEEKKKFAGAALKLFSEFKERNNQTGIFGDAEFGAKAKYKPLQVADLLVGVINRRFKEMVFRLPYKMQKPLDRLNRKGNIHVAFPHEELLKLYVKFLRELRLESSWNPVA